jgi:DNA-directed RNA polymerase specialized sigma24 family protein
MADDDPVTVWLRQWKHGDPDAVRALWDRYFVRLVALARLRLRNCRCGMADGEDMALSAFESFCRRAAEGRFPDMTDRRSLWRLLATFTARKVSRYIRRENARPCGAGELDEVLGREPDPAVVVEMAEECARLLAALPNPLLRRVAVLRMEGHTIDEIAEQINHSNTGVERRLNLIRMLWKREVGEVGDGAGDSTGTLDGSGGGLPLEEALLLEVGLLGRDFFWTAGYSSLSHRSMAAGLRCLARRAGFCGVCRRFVSHSRK